MKSARGARAFERISAANSASAEVSLGTAPAPTGPREVTQPARVEGDHTRLGSREPSAYIGFERQLAGKVFAGPTVYNESGLAGRLTEITAAEQSVTVDYRRAALRRLTHSTHCCRSRSSEPACQSSLSSPRFATRKLPLVANRTRPQVVGQLHGKKLRNAVHCSLSKRST